MTDENLIAGAFMYLQKHHRRLLVTIGLGFVLNAAGAAADAGLPSSAIMTVQGMPPVLDSNNLYSEIAIGHFSPAVNGAISRIYVPNHSSGDVTVIDPVTLKVVDNFKVGLNPQHVIPSWDLQTLWVANNAEGRSTGSLTPIDPKTGKPGKAIVVDDPYNMYFTPDGRQAIVVAESRKRLDLRDPHTMGLIGSISTPGCDGINHADFSIDGKYALFTCEFNGSLVKIDMVNRKVVDYLKLTKQNLPKTVLPAPDGLQPQICSSASGMPQDVRVGPTGKVWYVADMEADGVFLVDGNSFKQTGFIPTGIGTHGLYPSRDGKKLYVANRGSREIHGKKHGKGSLAVIDFATNKVEAVWPIPGGGSPDMGNVTADGQYIWLSGRFDNVVYRINTNNGETKSIAVGKEPHGLAVWPQPGRYSLGHTGNMR
jgi:YVTN family beta-propeller protein